MPFKIMSLKKVQKILSYKLNELQKIFMYCIFFFSRLHAELFYKKVNYSVLLHVPEPHYSSQSRDQGGGFRHQPTRKRRENYTDFYSRRYLKRFSCVFL